MNFNQGYVSLPSKNKFLFQHGMHHHSHHDPKTDEIIKTVSINLDLLGVLLFSKTFDPVQVLHPWSN